MERFVWNSAQTDLEPDEKGLIFKHYRYGIVADYATQGLQIVGTVVDTFRQLFRGRMNLDLLTDIDFSLTLNEKTFQLMEIDWLLGKSGKNSGYQYRLQNNDLGLVILFKQFHAKAETPASHLKIECSPWFLSIRAPEEVDDYLKRLSEFILVGAETYFPAIHLAVDVQGWEPDQVLSQRMLCKSKKCSQYNAMGLVEFNLSEISGIYEKGQSYAFGTASGVQLAIYNKTIQSRKIDKLDYMEHKWKQGTLQSDDTHTYDPEKDVFRIELRFHHSVIQQFSLGTFDMRTGEIGVRMSTYATVIEHLQPLWAYGLKSFQLKYNRNYLDPFWTILKEDVVFQQTKTDREHFKYQRYYKKPDSFSGKNYQLFLGNHLSACA
ncbi:MAG: hypothetical protein ACPGEF_06840, partial [Endozoicomonas sp.]